MFAIMGMKKFSIMDAEDKAKAEAKARREAPAAVDLSCEAASPTHVRVKLGIRPKK